MTEEIQRIAIAEACGWVKTVASGVWAFYVTNEKTKFARFDELPDYLNDLNAMHEAERALNISDEQITYWKNTLEFVCNRDNTITLMATAAQRAEAYLKTIGKWEDIKGTSV